MVTWFLLLDRRNILGHLATTVFYLVFALPSSLRVYIDHRFITELRGWEA